MTLKFLFRLQKSDVVVARGFPPQVRTFASIKRGGTNGSLTLSRGQGLRRGLGTGNLGVETGSIWTASATTHSRANGDFPSLFKSIQWNALSKGGVNGDLEAPNPRCAYTEKVAPIEKEKNRNYTLLIFNFAREDGLYTMTAKETPVKYTALRHCQRGELFPTGALLS